MSHFLYHALIFFAGFMTCAFTFALVCQPRDSFGDKDFD